MKESDIANALGKRLSDAALGFGIAWPNKASSLQPPYLVFDMVRTGRTNDELSGEAVRSAGYAQISVVAEKDAFATTAEDIAMQIADLYPAALTLAITGGKVKITKPADVLSGFPDDVSWRVPVRVYYEANKART